MKLSSVQKSIGGVILSFLFIIASYNITAYFYDGRKQIGQYEWNELPVLVVIGNFVGFLIIGAWRFWFNRGEDFNNLK